MDIQYCSDLHLEFPENRKLLRETPIVPKGEILILAGDIMPFKEIKQYGWHLDYFANNWRQVYWIPGNHEYYRSDILDRSGTYIEMIRDNVTLLNNKAVVIRDVKLIFSTLWTNITPRFDVLISQGMNDFHQITFLKKRMTIENYNQQHLLARFFLEAELLEQFEGKKVVVTHHVPTFLHWPEEYKGSPLTEAFGVELFPLIEESGPDYWIYGHHHSNREPFTIGKTQLLTNQLGYVHQGEHRHFDRERLI